MSANYRLRAISFESVTFSPPPYNMDVTALRSKEKLGKPFVIIGAMLYDSGREFFDLNDFDIQTMGIEQYEAIKKFSLMPLNDLNGNTYAPQAWMNDNLQEFEITLDALVLMPTITADQFPVVHILEKI